MTENTPENTPENTSELPEDDDAPVAPAEETAAEYAAIYADEVEDDTADEDEDGDDTGDLPTETEIADPEDGADPESLDPPAPPKGERIAKAMARAGVASRRDAERMILEGRVTVNGTKIASPALDVRPGDKVKIDGKPMDEPQETRLWLYYKPVGLVTSESDEKGRQTVFDALPRDLPRVMSVGRLDLNSEGLLLLTNDGELKRRLELPATGWLRRYRVRVNGTPSDLTFDPLRRGPVIDGEEFQPMEVKLDSQQGANAWLTVGLREGRNREIRRAMAHVGLIVNRLIRVGYGPFKLIGMEPNEVREVKRRVLKDQLGGLLTGDPDDKPRVFRARGTDDERGPRRDGERGGRSVRGEGDARAPRRDGDRPDRKPRTPRDGDDRARPARAEGYRDRAPRAEGDRKPRFARDDGGTDRKPRFARDTDAPERKPRAPRGEGGFDRKPRSGFAGGDKPRGPRSDARSDSRPGGRFDRSEGEDRPARFAGSDRPARKSGFGEGARSDSGPRGTRPSYKDRPQADGAPARKPRFEGGRDGDRPAKPAYRGGAGGDRPEGAARGPRSGGAGGAASSRPRSGPAGKPGRDAAPGARFGSKPASGVGQGREPRDASRSGSGKGPRGGAPGGAARGGPDGKGPRGAGPSGKGFGGKGPRGKGPGGRSPRG